jgi:anti-sigma factor RsiW
MKITEDLLIAYANGQADAATRVAIEAAMAADDALRARVEVHQRRLSRSAKRASASSGLAVKPAEIVDLAAVRARKTAPKAPPRPRRAWVQWSVLIACVAAGVILARGLGAMDAGPLIGDRHGLLMAQGALAQALDQQIAGSGPSGQPVKIGISFRAVDKVYCRDFQVVRGGLTGLACRGPDGWQVRLAGASGLASAVNSAVTASIEGSPLDAQAEAVAKAKGWRE